MCPVAVVSHATKVGEACVNYSHIWRRPEGLYVSIEDKGHIRDVLATWPSILDSRIAVVTDGEVAPPRSALTFPAYYLPKRLAHSWSW